jgi:hypothetical protein
MNYKKPLVYFVVLSTLFSLVPVVPFNYSSAATCDPDALRPVSYGQRGSAVRNAQACLIEAGYDIPAGATGYYGSQTRNAVRQFYRDWYGAWPGDRLGPQGVQQLRSLLAGGSEQSTDTDTETTTQQPTSEQPQQTQQNNQFMQLLMLMLPFLGVNLDATTTNQLMQAISSGDFTQLATVLANLRQQQQQQQQTQEGLTPGVPGLLSIDQDPSVSGVIVREGETKKVFGIRMRADSGAVSVKSIVLRWGQGNNQPAPHRVLSKLELVDSNDNVLYSTNVTSGTFNEDLSGRYYLTISGLNFVVPANSYRSVFVRVSLVGTLPNVSNWNNTVNFEVRGSEVRGVDGTGSTISASNDLTNANALTFDVESTLAGAAKIDASRNVNSPRTGYVFPTDQVNNKAVDVRALIVDITAKNDNLRITKIKGKVVNTSTVERVRVSFGNSSFSAVPNSAGDFELDVNSANFVVNRDQTQSINLSVDLRNATYSPATFTVEVSNIETRNSLGDTANSPVNVKSDVLSFIKSGPELTVNSKTLVLRARRDNNDIATTTIGVIEYVISVKAVGGSVYIPTASVATASIQKVDNTEVASTSLHVSAVEPSNTALTSAQDYYIIPEGSTVKFTLARDPSIHLTGNHTLRSKLTHFVWSPNGSTNISADFLINDQNYWTSLVNPQ